MTRAAAAAGTAGATSPPTITALTGLRALAASAVVLYHLRDPLFALLPATRVLDTWLVFGFLGVDVFFVLSGFIISYNYAHRFGTGRRVGYVDYLRARFARIYPVHCVTLLLVAGVVVAFGAEAAGAGRDLSLPTFLGNLLLLQALPGVEPWNGASWSISCEAAAYLVFPFCAAMLLRLGRPAALALAGVVAALTVLCAVAVGVAMTQPAIALFWVRIIGEFTIGCLLWAAYRHGVRRRRRWDLIAVTAVVSIVALLAVPTVRLVYWVVVPLLALLVVATACAAGPFRALLASRPMEWSGRVSYSLYLVHVPALAGMFVLLPPGALVDASLMARSGAIAAYVTGCVLASAAVYYAVEEPGRRRLRPRASVGADTPTREGAVSARNARS